MLLKQMRLSVDEVGMGPSDATLLDNVKAVVQASIRPCDEAVLHPGASYSDASLTFKNVAFKLSGSEAMVPINVFSADWCHGVSGILLDSTVVQRLLSKGVAQINSALQKTADTISNDLVDRDLLVGPQLECKDNRDLAPWSCGFDSSACGVGIYSSDDDGLTPGGILGTERAHRKYYLLCKAGAGVAAQEFSARLNTSIREGMTLSQCLAPGGAPGEEGLRRVSSAARRNRARLILKFAKGLGIDESVDNVIDNASCIDAPTERHAILAIDVQTNALVPLRSYTGTMNAPSNIGSTSTVSVTSDWLYCAGSVHPASCQGLVACSNVSGGMALLHGGVDAVGKAGVATVHNDAFDTVPFSSVRVASAASCLKLARSLKFAHPDDAWLRDVFVWKRAGVRLGPRATHADLLSGMLPVQLWGTHAPIEWVQRHARELGTTTLHNVRLRPLHVILAGTEPGKLRLLGSQLAK
tara:strand:- start:2681 stop:4087 length:1407 start_codon:yes stop_codon:yes gene_type:complete